MMEQTIERVQQKRYNTYKDSGVEWLGAVPEYWDIEPGFAVVSEKKEKNTGLKEDTVLSLSYGKIITKSAESSEGLLPESYETYQLVSPGDIIIRPTDLQNDKVSLRTGLAKDKGIITSAYLNLNVFSKFSSRFIHYYLHALDLLKVFYGLGSGLRQNLSFEDFKRLPFLLPPKKEQDRIATFLDEKTAQIDKAIAQKERLIELLNERRQIVIHMAVTRGLNPDVPLKDSGVKWIGDIPEHWEVKEIKHLCKINQKSLGEDTNKDYRFDYVDIGNVSLEYGIEDSEEFVFSEAPSRARRQAEAGDTIISTVRTYLKAIDYIDEQKSKYIYSTGFAILHPSKEVEPEYLAYAVRSDSFTNQVSAVSKGVSYPAINSTELGGLSIAIGPKKEQKEIVLYIKNKIGKIQEAINVQKYAINYLEEFKRSLINATVTGKIKV